MIVLVLLFETSVFADDKLYVTVEKTPEKWKFIGMSMARPGRQNPKQEILETKLDADSAILPSFEDSDECVYIGRYRRKIIDRWVNYDHVYSCVQRADKTKYLAVNSQLTAFLDTDFFFIAG
ncbi:hypothetical protein [Geomonas subterranea]|uniref:hypothetical protein n=1 Tax=Geomonas subterranea TaxID=2847989 RepID=UPI001CD27C3D|nr:hypothetical protein [Geomonas fuzhouensis]